MLGENTKFIYLGLYNVVTVESRMNGLNEIKLAGDILYLKNKFPIRVGFLPDIHAGESRAVCTPIFKTRDAGGILQTYHANEVQLMLHKLWLRNIELFKKHGVQHIFVIGDAFAGENKAEAGAFCPIELPDQVLLAADLLEEVYKGCDKSVDFFVWRGTGYHEQKAGETEMHEDLVRELKARGIPALYMYQTSYIEIDGGKSIYDNEPRLRRIFIAHEAATGLTNPASLVARDINWCLEAEASGATLPVDAIIRGHLHTWIHVDHSGKHAVQLPCWLGHVPYKNTIRYFFKLQPTLGGAMMLMDEYGRLQFWGGSYPFSFSKDERIKFHTMCQTIEKIAPEKRIPLSYGMNERCLS